MQLWFKESRKGDESLEVEYSGWPSEVDNDQLRASIEADTLTATGEVAKELNINHCMVIWHLKQIGKVTMLYKSVPRKQTAKQKKKKIILKSRLLLLYATITKC